MEEKGGFQGEDNGEHDVMQQTEAHGSCPHKVRLFALREGLAMKL